MAKTSKKNRGESFEDLDGEAATDLPDTMLADEDEVDEEGEVYSRQHQFDPEDDDEDTQMELDVMIQDEEQEKRPSLSELLAGRSDSQEDY